MEDLIIIVMVIIALVWNLLKKVKPGENGGKGNLFARYKAWLGEQKVRDLAEYIERMTVQTNGDQSDEDVFINGTEPDQAIAQQKEEDTEYQVAGGTRLIRETPERSRKPQMDPIQPVPVQQLRSGSLIPQSNADLRQAVVWSEIIGPPVALRDPFKRH